MKLVIVERRLSFYLLLFYFSKQGSLIQDFNLFVYDNFSGCGANAFVWNQLLIQCGTKLSRWLLLKHSTMPSHCPLVRSFYLYKTDGWNWKVLAINSTDSRGANPEGKGQFPSAFIFGRKCESVCTRYGTQNYVFLCFQLCIVLSLLCYFPSNIIFKTHAQFAVSLKSTRSIGFKTKSNILGTALNSKQFVFLPCFDLFFALFHFLAFFFSWQSKNPLKQFIWRLHTKKQRVNNRWYLCCLQFPCVVVVVCFLFGWCVLFFCVFILLLLDYWFWNAGLC